MAKIRNEELALSTPCTCFIKEGQQKICYSDGAIGVLSEEQIEKYCSAGVIKKDIPEDMEKGITLFGKTAEICSDYKSMGYNDYWDCVSDNMKKSK